MKRFLFFALGAIFLNAGADAQNSQDAPATSTSAAPTAIVANSSLPPIFTVGNYVNYAGIDGIFTFKILDVRGEWILAQHDTAKPAWIHPGATTGSWSQN